MKGQSALLTHAIMTGITISLVLVVIVTFNSIRTDYQFFSSENEMKQICYLIASSIEGIYSDEISYFSEEKINGRILVNLPEKVSGLEYRTIFFNKTLHIITSSAGLNSSCFMGPDAYYTGSTSGGLTEIVYFRKKGDDWISVKKII